MSKNNVYPRRRWFMLLIFMLLTMVVELQWLTHAPIARVAKHYYKDQIEIYTWLNIDALAVIYLIMYIIMCLPASYIIDTYGIKKGIGIGALLTIVGALMKGIFGDNLLIVFMGQLVLAIAQPFIINGVTAFSARWFHINERGMAAGFLALAQYLGILLVMLITPILVEGSIDSDNYGAGIDTMLLWYMVPSIVAGALILMFLKEHPDNIPFNKENIRLPFTKGLLHLFRLKDSVITIILFAIGLGIFNSISTLVDSLTAYLNIKDSDGLIGGIMLIGGILGAIILPILSDKYKKRKLFLVLCIMGIIPAVTGLAYAIEIANIFNLSVSQTYNIALTSSFILGFSIMSAGPIGFQYTAEITSPTPESTSQGILLLIGQVSGITIITIMSINDNMYLGMMMKAFVPLSIIALLLTFFLKDSKIASY